MPATTLFPIFPRPPDKLRSLFAVRPVTRSLLSTRLHYRPRTITALYVIDRLIQLRLLPCIFKQVRLDRLSRQLAKPNPHQPDRLAAPPQLMKKLLRLGDQLIVI